MQPTRIALVAGLAALVAAAPAAATPGPDLATPRSLHAAALLQNGKVLAIGGQGLFQPPSSAELYDPATSTFTAVGDTGPREAPTAITLQSGLVLVAGGFGLTSPTASAVLFNPRKGTWRAPRPMHVARWRASPRPQR